jgi:hypothetical protein
MNAPIKLYLLKHQFQIQSYEVVSNLIFRH